MHQLSIILTLAVCVIAASAKTAEIPHQLLTRSNNEFGAKLYGTITSANVGKNLVCSPLSAFLVLSMLERGSKGCTDRRLKQVLRLPYDDATINRNFKELMEFCMEYSSVENNFSVANKVYVNDKWTVKEEFMKLTKDIFKSQVQKIDVLDSKGSAKIINDWVSERTQNKINNLVNSDMINQDTRMLLVNALFFKGKWTKPFVKKLTSMQPFTSKDKKIEVPTMSVQSNFMYGRIEDLKAQFVQLPYMNKDFEMVIVVPDEIDGLSKIEKKLATFDHEKFARYAKETKVSLHLPKFKFESTIDLEKVLKQIGLQDIFYKPNLSGISDEPLKVSNVVQKAIIEVDEEGSKAAAATVVVASARSSRPHWTNPPIVLKVDRPFYFMIKKVYTVLFHGHVYNPIV